MTSHRVDLAAPAGDRAEQLPEIADQFTPARNPRHPARAQPTRRSVPGVGRPGTGKSVIKESRRQLPDKDDSVTTVARTLNTCTNTVKILKGGWNNIDMTSVCPSCRSHRTHRHRDDLERPDRPRHQRHEDLHALMSRSGQNYRSTHRSQRILPIDANRCQSMPSPTIRHRGVLQNSQQFGRAPPHRN